MGVAKEILQHFEVKLNEMRSRLALLPSMTERAELFVGMAATERREKFLERTLHQWHAHGDLPWLTRNNVVGAFEALVHSDSVQDMTEFCAWIGELSAQIHAGDADSESQGVLGAWDTRLPRLFWGDVYTRFLLGEASRSKPVFDDIVRRLVKKVGGKVSYKDVPIKNYKRIAKKQVEYASFGMLAFHVALDHMSGCFQKLLRTDLEMGLKETKHKHTHSRTGAILVLALLGPGVRTPAECIGDAEIAIQAARAPHSSEPTNQESAQPESPASPPTASSDACSVHAPVVVLFQVHPDYKEHFQEAKAKLEERGADVVSGWFGARSDEVGAMRSTLESALKEAY